MSAPAEVGDVELTALCYHMDSFLFTSTNRGHVCAWDTNTQACVLIWEADDGEIGKIPCCQFFRCFLYGLLLFPQFPDPGVLLCRENRLFAGSNTRRVRVWDVGAMQTIKSKEKVCSLDDR